MKLLFITTQDEWDEFQSAQPYAQFLQSWSWGEFRISQSSPVKRYALVDDAGTWRVAIQLEYRRRKFGLGYWFAARGPVFAKEVKPDERRIVLMTLCEELLKISELRRSSLFWRIEPNSELAHPEGLMPLSFRRAHAMNPASTIILDLDVTEDDLLKKMHEKTRYNIRVAERHGVKVRLVTSIADIETFLNLMEETARRDHIIQHSRAYLRATYSFLHERGLAEIRVAEQQGNILAGSLEVMFGDTVTYLYGASSSESRNVMAPFALHWNAIRDAKAKGLKLYDFGGSNPQSKAMYYYKPSWEGITRFKLGWGGRLLNLVGTWDLPFNAVLYRLAFLKQFFRG